MIIDALAVIFFGVLELVLGLLPEGDPIGLEEFSGIWYGYGWLNGWLPLTEVLAMIGLMLGLYAAIYAAAAVMTLWRMIPFKFS